MPLSHHSTAPASTVATAAACEPLAVEVYWTVSDRLDNAAIADLTHELSADEAEQAQRFRFDRDRATYVAAHVLLRRTLRLRLAGAEPSIVRNPLGRPELTASLPGGPVISFNLTHSRGFAACAIVEGTGIGIDAEDIRRPLDIAEMAARWYAPTEQLLLEASPEPRRTELFFRIWTLKEAILKSTGRGLRVEPNRFAVDPDHAMAAVPGGLGIPTRWRLAELNPLPYIRVALAIPGTGALMPRVTRIALG